MDNLQRDKETFHYMWSSVESGEITYINSSEDLFKKLTEHYPIGFYRIDWDKIPNEHYHIQENYPASVGIINNLVKDIFSSNKISLDEIVYLIFDGYNKCAFLMNIDLFINFSGEIFTEAQHTYVFPLNFEWCLNYTMEDFLYWGKALV